MAYPPLSARRQLLFSLFNGLISAVLVFFLAPALFMRGVPDPIWIALDTAFSLLCAWILLERFGRVGLGYHWLALPLQWLLLFSLRAPLRQYWSADDWTVIPLIVLWPLLIITGQWLFLVLLRLVKKYRRKKDDC